MRFLRTPMFLCTTFLFLASAASADWLDDIGWRALLEQQGGALEDGTGIVVSQVESPWSNDSYMPDPDYGHFPGMTFTDGTGTNVGDSTHATWVGRIFYGNTNGFAGGISMVTNYEAGDWIDNMLGFNLGGDPLPHPYQIQNHSWVGTNVGNGVTTNIQRRMDFVANRDNVSFIVGSANGGGSIPDLLIHGYNLISVGKTSGGHAYGPTRFYGSGRYKPEIVAPKTNLADVTSYATAAVSAAAGVLREAGGGANGNVTNATQNEVIKALLLAGATKEEFPTWDRTPTRPLDDQFGAGQVNIFHSYNILQGGEFDGTASTPGVAAGLMGWDYAESIASQNYYSFDVPNGATDVSILLTWNVEVVDLVPDDENIFQGDASLTDMNLELTDSNGATIDTSISSVDNLEHIYIANLAPGQYTLRVESDTDIDYALAWRMTANAGPVVITPDSLVVGIGTVNAGGIPELAKSDNQYLVLDPLFLSFRYQLEFTVNATSPTSTPSALEFGFESRAFNLVGTVEQNIELYDYASGQFEEIDSRLAAASDTVVSVTPGGDPARFVNSGANEMRARISYQNSLPFWVFSTKNLYLPYRVRADHVYWNISP